MAAKRLYGGFMGTALVGGPLLVAGVIWAIPAMAEPSDYINDMHNAGITSDAGDSGLLQTGWQVCDMIASGVSPSDVKAHIVYNSDTNEGINGVEPAQANEMVNYAMVDLCPSA